MGTSEHKMKIQQIVEQQGVPGQKKEAPNQKTPYEKKESGVIKKIKDARDILSQADLDYLAAYPEALMKKWRETIAYAAKVPEWKWANALQLTDWTMKNAGVSPEDEEYGVDPVNSPRRWQQYRELFTHAVDSLAGARGLEGPWRLSAPVKVTEEFVPPVITETKFTGKHRYFVSMPGVEDEEVVDVKSMDEVIEPIQNKLRKYSKKARIAHRTESGCILKVYDKEDQPVETIYIKQFPVK